MKLSRWTPPLARVMDKVRYTAYGCWEWTGYKTDQGYGSMKMDGHRVPAHRAAYTLLVGPVDAGTHLHHRCNNRACVNPDHLQPLSPRDHLYQGDTLNRKNAQKTHCPRGHEYTLENTYRWKGGRTCRLCQAARSRACYLRHRAPEVTARLIERWSLTDFVKKEKR